MKRTLIALIGCIVLGVFLVSPAASHTPFCSCSDNGDGTITCEGGFSDGSSAAGVIMKIVTKNGKVLVEGRMDDDAEFTFKKPQVPYTVILDAGPEHVVVIAGEDITE